LAQDGNAYFEPRGSDGGDGDFFRVLTFLDVASLDWMMGAFDMSKDVTDTIISRLLSVDTIPFQMTEWFMNVYGPITLNETDAELRQKKACLFGETEWLRANSTNGFSLPLFLQIVERGHLSTVEFILSTRIMPRSLASVRAKTVRMLSLVLGDTDLSYDVLMKFVVSTTDVLEETEMKWLLSKVVDFQRGGTLRRWGGENELVYKGGTGFDTVALFKILLMSHHSLGLFEFHEDLRSTEKRDWVQYLRMVYNGSFRRMGSRH
jgi:hypothetical protein